MTSAPIARRGDVGDAAIVGNRSACFKADATRDRLHERVIVFIPFEFNCTTPTALR